MTLLLAGVLLFAAAALLVLGRRPDPAMPLIETRLTEVAAIGKAGGAVEPAAGGLTVRLRTLLSPFERAGISLTPERAVSAVLLVGLGVFVLALLVGPVLTGVLLLVAVAVATWWLSTLSRRRTDRLLAALPEVLESMRQAVMAGSAPSAAFARALEGQSSEVRRRFRSVEMRLRLGLPLAEALEPTVERLQLGELRLLQLLFRTHQTYGGSFNEMLENLVKTLRNRHRIQREFKAATGEIRMSIRVVQAVPVVVALAVWTVKPSHLQFFLSADGIGYGMATLALYAGGVVVTGWLSRASY